MTLENKVRPTLREYLPFVIALITPAVITPAVIGVLSWYYQDQIFPLLKPATPQAFLAADLPGVVSTETPPLSPTSPPEALPAPAGPAHLFSFDGRYYVCNPVSENATRAYESLDGYGVPVAPFHLIINGELYEPTDPNDELFTLMSARDFACLDLDSGN